MHSFCIKIADIPVSINTIYSETFDICKDYLTDEEPEFIVSVSDEDIEFERKKSIAEHEYEHLRYPDFSPGELEITAVYRKIANILPKYNAIVFHGAAIAVNNKCYLFTASSGTGKTTHIKLWLKNIGGSYVVNGDKPVLRVMDGKIYVCGTPWRGKENFGCNAMVELDGICILNRGKVNTIKRITPTSAASVMLGQSYRPSETASLLNTIGIINIIMSDVKLYSLECNMDDEAATVSYRGMTEW